MISAHAQCLVPYTINIYSKKTSIGPADLSEIPKRVESFKNTSVCTRFFSDGELNLGAATGRSAHKIRTSICFASGSQQPKVSPSYRSHNLSTLVISIFYEYY